MEVMHSAVPDGYLHFRKILVAVCFSFVFRLLSDFDRFYRRPRKSTTYYWGRRIHVRSENTPRNNFKTRAKKMFALS